MTRGIVVLGMLIVGGALSAAEPDRDAVERGKKALLGRAFNQAAFPFDAYDNAWKVWGLKEKPADYDRAFRDRYGLHPAPFDNDKYPMGLRASNGLLGKGLTTDCLACHGGSIFGKSYVGLGNASGDYHALLEELSTAAGNKPRMPFQFSRARGTSEAFAMTAYLLGTRNADLSIALKKVDLGVHDDLVEDTPAWWLLKKKRTMYHDGGADSRSVRALMQFMLNPLNGPQTFEREEAAFRDVQAYLLSLEAPKYPLPIDRELAKQGEKLFRRDCARCHGSYGEEPTYPNKIVPLEVIGTDPTRHGGIEQRFTDYYNASWFAGEKGGPDGAGFKGKRTDGYQAPPLDGVWATAPYLHNGSVPTAYHVLNSKARPKVFTRSYRTEKDDYDPGKLGWKFTELDRSPDASLPAVERRKVYDTSRKGHGNAGHTFGDHLTDRERAAIIEYLKTL